MKKSKIIIIAVMAAVFGITCFLGFSGIIDSFEEWLPKAINPNGNVNSILYAFTVLGDTILDVVIIAALVIIPVTSKKIGIPVAATAIGSVIINKLIKNIVARERPIERLVEASGYSFPSGHAMNNMAIYLMLAFCIMPYCKTKTQKGVTLGVLLAFPIIMGISRVYFNVHYFSDVVCGWSIGVIVAILFNEIFKKVYKDAENRI